MDKLAKEIMDTALLKLNNLTQMTQVINLGQRANKLQLRNF